MKRAALNATIAAAMLSAVIFTALSATAVSAATQTYAWCAVYRSGAENCGFTTQAQCMNAVSGIGGFCRMNY